MKAFMWSVTFMSVFIKAFATLNQSSRHTWHKGANNLTGDRYANDEI